MKNKKNSDRLPVVSEREKIASPVSQARNDTSTALSASIVIGTWKGLPQYVCAVCGFDTLNEAVALNHLVDRHNSEAALARLLEIEKAKSPAATQQPPTQPQTSTFGEGRNDKDVFEVELIETDSTMDAQGSEHKNFTIKEN